MDVIHDYGYPHMYALAIHFHIIMSLAFGLAQVLYVIFSHHILHNLAITSAILVGNLLLVALVCIIVWKILYPEAYKSLRKCQILLAVMQVLTVVLGVVPRVLVFFVGWNHYILFSTVLPCLLIPVVFYFLIETPIHYFAYYEGEVKVHKCIIFVHLVILIVSIGLTPVFWGLWDTVAIIGTQIMFFPVCLLLNIDLLVVWYYGLLWTTPPSFLAVTTVSEEAEKLV